MEASQLAGEELGERWKGRYCLTDYAVVERVNVPPAAEYKVIGGRDG